MTTARLFVSGEAQPWILEAIFIFVMCIESSHTKGKDNWDLWALISCHTIQLPFSAIPATLEDKKKIGVWMKSSRSAPRLMMRTWFPSEYSGASDYTPVLLINSRLLNYFFNSLVNKISFIWSLRKCCTCWKRIHTVCLGSPRLLVVWKYSQFLEPFITRHVE